VVYIIYIFIWYKFFLICSYQGVVLLCKTIQGYTATVEVCAWIKEKVISYCKACYYIYTLQYVLVERRTQAVGS